MAAYGSFQRYGATNPFQGLSDLQQEYYRGNEQAVYGAYLNAQGGAAPRYRQFLQSWLPDVYRQWEGAVAMQPDLQFTDYLGRQNAGAAYEESNPYARGLRAGRRTRWVRR